MRILALPLVAALALAGCAAPGGVLQPGTTDAGADGGRSEPGSPTQSADEPLFCEAEEGCDFFDDDYHEYVLYDVDTTLVDVLIVPSASPAAAQDTATLRAAVDAWAAGIEAIAEPWFAEAFELRVYTLGTDTPPADALQDPEIVVLAAEYNPVLLFGIGLQSPAAVCRDDAAGRYAPHAHDGMSIFAAKCDEGGLTCVAFNTVNLGGGPGRLYDLVSHEFGHCLGGGHVGDALDFKAKRVPVRDIMSYQHDPEQVHCVSNLNVRVLEAIYAPLVGATVGQPVRAGQFYTMSPAEYRQVECGA